MRPAFILLSGNAKSSPPSCIPEGKPLHNFSYFIALKKRHEKEPVFILVLFHASLGSVPHIVMSNNLIVIACVSGYI